MSESSSSASSPQWFLGIDNEALGPLEESQVKALFLSGKANHQTQAWLAGMTDWAAAETLEGLKKYLLPPQLKSRPPALPRPPESMQPPAIPVATMTATLTVTLPAASPALAADLSDASWHVGLSFEEIIARLGMTMHEVEGMATKAIDLASHTKTALQLASPQRWGLYQLRSGAVAETPGKKNN